MLMFVKSEIVQLVLSHFVRECGFDFKRLIFECVGVIIIFSAISFGWMTQDTTDDKSTLVQVMD